MAASGSLADDDVDSLTLHGAGSLSAGVTNGPSYLSGTGRGRVDNLEAALQVRARPDQQFSAAAQVYFAQGNRIAQLDWGYAAWRYSRSLSLRVGRVSYPAGLVGEERDVGTLRPFLALPIGIYGPGAMVPESYLGLGFSGEAAVTSWTVGYDLYAGELKTDHLQFTVAAGAATTVGESRPGGGARLTLKTPFERLAFAVSAAYAPTRATATALAIVGVSTEYDDDPWRARAEYFHRQFLSALAEDAAYVELARFVTSYLQLAARLDFSRAQLLSATPSGSADELTHLDVAFGVNAWVTRHFVVKMSVHDVSGRRFIEPSQSAAGPASRTVLYELGAQVSF